jgi:hypothetical protein
MPRPHKYPKSRNPWFRIVVPADLRDEIGKTEIRQSLGTTNPTEAQIRHAELLAVWKTRFSEARRGKERKALDEAPKVVEIFLQKMAEEQHGDLDAAIYAIQKSLVVRLLAAWGPYEFKARAADQALGYMPCRHALRLQSTCDPEAIGLGNGRRSDRLLVPRQPRLEPGSRAGQIP